MKKQLLLLLSLLLTTSCLFAQTQKYMGPYEGDELASSGLGITSLPGTVSVGAELKADYLKKYDGCKIVGMRFGLVYSAGACRVFIKEFKNGTAGAELVSKDVSASTEGWNEVTLDNPYTISADGTNSLLIGFDYTQTSSSSTGYPLSACGTGYEGCFYLYANGSWISQGSDIGCLSVQCLVESSTGFTNDISISDLSVPSFAKAGSDVKVKYSCRNFNTTAVKCDFVVKVDGKQVTSRSESISNETSTFTDVINLDNSYAMGKHNVEVCLNSVEGATPEGDTSDDSKTKSFSVYVDKVDRQKQLVEQFTGTWCGYCPKGEKVLKALQQKRDDIAWVAVHCGDEFSLNEYGTLSDYMDVSGYPSASFNRACADGSNDLAPTISWTYAENGANYCSDLIDQTNEANPNFVTLDINATYNDEGKINIAVKGTGVEYASTLIGDDGRLTVYLTEDGLDAKQYDYSVGSYVDCTHNNVLRAIVSNAAGDGITWNGDNFEANYTLTLDNSWNVENMRAIAFVGKRVDNKTENTDKWVYNTNMVSISKSTGINTVVNSEAESEVSRFTIDGQKISAPVKGINIVKMSNGKVKKIIVK